MSENSKIERTDSSLPIHETADVRALLLELTTFRGKLVSGDYLARRAAAILGAPASDAHECATVDGYLTTEQIAAGAAVKCDHGQALGRNVAIDVFDAMTRASGQEGGAA